MKSTYVSPLILLLLLSCAGFPSRKWIKRTRNSDQKTSQKRIIKIAHDFNKINPKDRKFAIETIAQNTSKSGQSALLYSLRHDIVRKDPAMKKLVIDTLKKRNEKDTAQKLLDVSIKHIDLLDRNLVPYLHKQLGIKIAKPITKVLSVKPEELTPALLEYFINIDYKPSTQLILKAITKNPKLINNKVATYFISNKEDQAPKSFLNAIQKKDDIIQYVKVAELFLHYKYSPAATYILKQVMQHPDWASSNLLLYFGSVKHSPSIPFIKQQIDQHKLIESAIQSLYLMEEFDLNLYILALSRDPHPSIRLHSLENLVLMKDENIRNKSRPDFVALLKNHKNETTQVNLAGIPFFKDNKYNEHEFTLLKIVYKQNKIKKVRLKSLEIMASIKNVTVAVMQKILQGNLRGSDIALLKQNHKKKIKKRKITYLVTKKKIKKEKKHSRKKKQTKQHYACRPKKKYAKSWIKKLQRRFIDQFDKDLTVSIKRKVNNVITAYASSSNAKSALIQRGYKKQLGLNQKETINAMKKGLNYPGSLSIIVWQIHKEYKKDSMRIYALSDFFHIDRWEAKEIFYLVRKKCL